MAEVQRSSDAHTQAQQNAKVIHQQHRGPPLLSITTADGAAATTGLDKLIQTPQALTGIPVREKKTRSNVIVGYVHTKDNMDRI